MVRVAAPGRGTVEDCILGEIPKTSGEVRICGSAAYVSQSAWIQSGNIEENVLFGNPMDKAKYKRILHACSLKKDLELFSHGDQTIIGDRGINWSGGQKQRVQLARALYQDADIYLLDDPFNAVDAHTGSELFKEGWLRWVSEDGNGLRMGLADGIAGVVRYGYGLKVIAVIAAVRIERSGLRKRVFKISQNLFTEGRVVAVGFGRRE
ncbi:hypothetical protein LXL04_020251 [Taraxacum kok-saghyz]